MKMRQGEPLRPDYGQLPYDELQKELKEKTIWEVIVSFAFVHKSRHLQNIC